MRLSEAVLHAIRNMPRRNVEKLLETYSAIQFDGTEDTEMLKETLRNNIRDETISPEEVLNYD